MDAKTEELRAPHHILAEFYAERLADALDHMPVDRAVLGLFCGLTLAVPGTDDRVSGLSLEVSQAAVVDDELDTRRSCDTTTPNSWSTSSGKMSARVAVRLEAIAADIAGDGDTALGLLGLNAYDIAVLDRDIPGPPGTRSPDSIVASGSSMPILMLTAADRHDDKASGFGLSAHDYLTKPFELR